MVSTLVRKVSLIVAGMCIFSDICPNAHSAGSLSDLDIEYSALKVAIEKLLGENHQLSEALALNSKALSDVRQSLADANGENAVFMRQAKQMRLRMDALGIDSVGGDSITLEQRLIAAISEFRSSKDQSAKLSESLAKLCEVTSLYARTATTIDPQARLIFETEVRRANEVLGIQQTDLKKTGSPPALLKDSVVVSVKDELSLIVINSGERNGVKIGMPFRIIRDDKVIARIRVVDVRERISGAIVQNLNTEKNRIKIGDYVKADAQ